MMKYLKGRMKSYIFVIVGLLIGFLIAGLAMESPDYKTGITVVSIGLLIGELLVFITWQKNKNNKLVE